MEFSTLVSRISTGIRNMPLVMRNLSIVVVTFAVAFVLTGILSCILDTLYELIIEYSLLFVLPVTLLTAWAIGKNTLTMVGARADQRKPCCHIWVLLCLLLGSLNPPGMQSS